MSTGTSVRTIEYVLRLRRHGPEPVDQPAARARVALGLQRQDVARQGLDGVAQPGRIDRERSVLLGAHGACLQQEVQLDRDAAPVRLVDAEPQRAEHRGQHRRGGVARHRGVDQPAIRQELQRPLAAMSALAPRWRCRSPRAPGAPWWRGRRRGCREGRGRASARAGGCGEERLEGDARAIVARQRPARDWAAAPGGTSPAARSSTSPVWRRVRG